MNFDFLITHSFSIAKAKKEKLLLEELNALTRHHLESCQPYKILFENLCLSQPPYATLEEIPSLPVGVFKRGDWSSVSSNSIYKQLLSSGTSRSIPSKVVLDFETAQRQTKALTAIMADFIGAERRPLLIVDNEATLNDSLHVSAAGAALLGWMRFGRDPLFLLDNEDVVKKDALHQWTEKHDKEIILIIGSTYKIWKALLQSLDLEIQFSNAILIHGGGWKRLQDQAISNEQFKLLAKKHLGVTQCHNFYGFAEQVGSIFVECSEGLFHAPSTSHIIIRDPATGADVERRKEGVLQALSVIPLSYPGHSLLTEDVAFWGEDD